MSTLVESLIRATPDLRSRFPGGVRIVADDLTGACDAAVAFLGQMDVRVWLDAQAGSAAPEMAQAFTTNSRDLSARDAAAVTRQAFAIFAERHDLLTFKKIDSCMRGPVVAEIIAAHQALDTKAVVMSPSFPAAGRVVKDGVLKIHSDDGIRSLDLHTFFPDDLQASVAFVQEKNHIDHGFKNGKIIFLCDAQQQGDLEEIVAWDTDRVLFAGSAGMAYALAGAQPGTTIGEKLPRCGKTLIVCGTNHPVTLRQVEALKQETPDAVLLSIRAEAEDAPAIRDTFAGVQPEALVLTGGDTALLVLKTLDADSILLRGEFAAGIPWGIVQGGRAHGCVVVTKSGGFGAADTLVRLVRAMEEKE